LILYIPRSDHEKLFTRLFENSPSPDTSEPEDKDNPPLWQYEIVGEEVTGKGEVRYVPSFFATHSL
jgi:hypothetical protein